MGLLDGQIAAAIAKGFNGKLLKGTLRKLTTTGQDSYGDPIQTHADFLTQGFVDNYSDIYRAQAGIPNTDVRITLIAGLTRAAPAKDDEIMMQGSYYRIRAVSADPALAHYECQSFGVSAWAP